MAEDTGVTKRKTIIKWSLLLTFLLAAVFCFSMFREFFVAGGDKTSADDIEIPEETEETGETPKETVYSVLPRRAEIREDGLYQHLGGAADERLKAVYVTKNLSIALLETSSDSYDFKADGVTTAAALFTETELKKTLTLGSGERYLDSAASPEGIYIAVAAGVEAYLYLINYDIDIEFKTPFGDAVAAEIIYDRELTVIAAFDDKIALFGLNEENAELKSELSFTGLTGIFSVFSYGAGHAVAAEGKAGTVIFSYSQNNGFTLQKRLDKLRFKQIIPFIYNSELHYAVIAEEDKTPKPALKFYIFDQSFSAVEETEHNAENAYIVKKESGFLLFSGKCVKFYCAHLESVLTLYDDFDWTVLDVIDTPAGEFYLVCREGKTAVLKLTDVEFSEIRSFNARNGALIFYQGGYLRYFSDSESSLYNNFGGSDILFVTFKP
ncbi:MAG: hypothetical protein ACOYIN_01635 [Christensenellales bacterium]|jgi:hypothetical protein|nr:hypothetical protein [Clostridia bacterium]HRU84765.1 hypothetical protein [Eubacteriales bacterium]